jgi:hypothetical protein
MEEREFDFKDSEGYWFSGCVYIDESRPGNHKYVIEYDWIDDPQGNGMLKALEAADVEIVNCPFASEFWYYITSEKFWNEIKS